MSEFDLDATAIGEAIEEPIDTLASVLLFIGVGALSAGVGVMLFIERLVADVCATSGCARPIYALGNDVLGIVAAVGAVTLIGGMLLPEVAGGDLL